MTLDYSLSAVAAPTRSARRLRDRPSLLPGHMILELKYAGHMPAVFRELADTFALTPGRASKYRVAADALGIAKLAPEQGAAPTVHA